MDKRIEDDIQNNISGEINGVPMEHKPFGQKVECPIECECGKKVGYCIGMVCWCKEEGLEHEDFEYKEESDGFHFYFPCCNLEIEVTLGKWKKLCKLA